jgi:hypothetical protein
MRMITPTEVRPHLYDGSTHRLYAFANGNTASLIQLHDASGYEMATILPNEDIVDVVDGLDEEQVQRELERREDEPAGMRYEY